MAYVEKDLTTQSRILLNVEDLHQEAKYLLKPSMYDFCAAGADDQQTFRRIKLRPRVFIDVSSHTMENSENCQTQILNSRSSFPFIIAPTASDILKKLKHVVIKH
jgi:isopentenyl diphosphate isomerase/L-lactate dehydrogenase-like FMN-dependent dehydrogenase